MSCIDNYFAVILSIKSRDRGEGGAVVKTDAAEATEK